MLQSLRRYQITRPGRLILHQATSIAFRELYIRHTDRSGRRSGDVPGDGECAYDEERLDEERRDRIVAGLTDGRFEHPSSTCLCQC